MLVVLQLAPPVYALVDLTRRGAVRGGIQLETPSPPLLGAFSTAPSRSIASSEYFMNEPLSIRCPNFVLGLRFQLEAV